MKKWTFMLALTSLCGFISAQTAGELRVSAFTSQTTTPTYAPKNIVAMWITDSNGKFVKTLMAYAGERKQYLLAWKAVTTIASTMYNTTDAVSGATLSSHGTRTCIWNAKNTSSVLVADGTYTLKMELTDNDGSKQNLASFNFTKGTSSQTITPPTTSSFSNINIQWIPVNTAIDEVEANNIYKILPNPARNSIFISGYDIEEIDICTVNGKFISNSTKNHINIESLESGIYIVKITTPNGNFIKKFIKQ